MEQISMFYCVVLLLIIIRADARVLGGRGDINGDEVSFDENYVVTWGQDHVLKLNQEREVQLSFDQSSGCGFESKTSYGSGFFHMRIKVPEKDSAGVVTAFYMTSKGDKHDELDFEFLGNREGKPITVQTNVFCDGVGDREQRLLLWFDPTKDFHSYKILWNPSQIVYYVDDVPIRVFKNSTSKGVCYPSKAMQVEGSLWNGESWATDGGQTKINWTHSPFKAYFQGFDISGCSLQQYDQNIFTCRSSRYWWNKEKYWEPSDDELKAYKNVKQSYMNYDYCSDLSRYPVPPKECGIDGEGYNGNFAR